MWQDSKRSYVVNIVFCASAGQSSCDQNSGDWFQTVLYGAPESGWPSSDCSWQCYYMLVNAVSSSGVAVTLERNILLRLRSEINIKKYRNKT